MTSHCRVQWMSLSTPAVTSYAKSTIVNLLHEIFYEASWIPSRHGATLVWHWCRWVLLGCTTPDTQPLLFERSVLHSRWGFKSPTHEKNLNPCSTQGGEKNSIFLLNRKQMKQRIKSPWFIQQMQMHLLLFGRNFCARAYFSYLSLPLTFPQPQSAI